MARPLRIEAAGAYSHVVNRGSGRQKIVADDQDRQEFLGVLAKVVAKYNLRLHAYCLMDNHYHLLVETVEANLSRAIRQLNGVYGQRFNRRHGRSGHVFQGRFRSVLIEKDSYLLELNRYIVLNPVRARMVGHPRRWKWSSYRATVGETEAPEWLTTKEVLGMMGRRTGEARAAYREFVAAGINTGGDLDRSARRSPILGGAAFQEQYRKALRSKKAMQEIPKASRYALRPPLRDLMAGHGKRPQGKRAQRKRAEACRRAHADYGYTLREIGEQLGMHYAAISRIVNAEI